MQELDVSLDSSEIDGQVSERVGPSIYAWNFTTPRRIVNYSETRCVYLKLSSLERFCCRARNLEAVKQSTWFVGLEVRHKDFCGCVSMSRCGRGRGCRQEGGKGNGARVGACASAHQSVHRTIHMTLSTAMLLRSQRSRLLLD